MIKSFTEEESEHIKINVDLKNGRSFLNKDIPSKPFEINGMVSFWVGDDLKIIPLSEIREMNLFVERE